MRIMLAGLVASVTLAFALPAHAQQEAPQPGTQAYCKTLKTTKARSECLKRVQAQAQPKSAPKTQAKAKTRSKPPKSTPAPKVDATAAASPPSPPLAAPASNPTSTVAVPPLPQRTI
jgi:hypothetical protein